MTRTIKLDRSYPSSFKHAGDAGDIIYSLPVVRFFGGGVFHLESALYTRVRMTPERVSLFRDLFMAQPYITDVVFHYGKEVAFNLNAFRNRFREFHRKETLVEMQLNSQGVPLSELGKPWIWVEPRRESEVVINLTERYRNSDFPWADVYGKYKSIAGFVGNKREHELFESTYGTIRHIKTDALIDVARVIRGSKLFIGNQSCPLAIAHAMHHPTICEHSRTGIDGMHRTINCAGTAGKNIELPDL